MNAHRAAIFAGTAILFALAAPAALAQSSQSSTASLPAQSASGQTQAGQSVGPNGRIRVAAEVEAKMLQHAVAPVYPAIAQVAHIQGTVTLHAIIGQNGAVKELEYISGPPLLMKAAMDAVRQWKYKPFLFNVEPVEVDTAIRVVFAIGGTGAEESLNRSPALTAKIQALLPANTQILVAAFGYNGIRDFEDAVFVARDLGIPFDQLKCAELGSQFCSPPTSEKAMSLSKAIHALKPEMSKDDVKAAEKKAKEEAKSL